MRPSTDQARRLLAVPGGPVKRTCSRDKSASAICCKASSRSTNVSDNSLKKAFRREAAAVNRSECVVTGDYSILHPESGQAPRSTSQPRFPELLDTAEVLSSLLPQAGKVALLSRGRNSSCGKSKVVWLVSRGRESAVSAVGNSARVVVTNLVRVLGWPRAAGGLRRGHIRSEYGEGGRQTAEPASGQTDRSNFVHRARSGEGKTGLSRELSTSKAELRHLRVRPVRVARSKECDGAQLRARRGRRSRRGVHR